MLTKTPKAATLKRRPSNRRRSKVTKNGKEDGIDMLHALRDFIGCVEGPGDLSTNKKYFEDFGR